MQVSNLKVSQLNSDTEWIKYSSNRYSHETVCLFGFETFCVFCTRLFTNGDLSVLLFSPLHCLNQEL